MIAALTIIVLLARLWSGVCLTFLYGMCCNSSCERKKRKMSARGTYSLYFVLLPPQQASFFRYPGVSPFMLHNCIKLSFLFPARVSQCSHVSSRADSRWLERRRTRRPTGHTPRHACGKPRSSSLRCTSRLYCQRRILGPLANAMLSLRRGLGLQPT